MKSFRNPEYLERYEDVVFDLEQALATPANNAHQTKTGHRFVTDKLLMDLFYHLDNLLQF